MADSHGRLTMADIDTDVVLAAVRGQRHLGLSDAAEQLEQFYPAKLVWAKLSKLARQRVLDCGCSIRHAWIVADPKQPPCDDCGVPEAWQVLDPFVLEVHGELRVRPLCATCYQVRREEI